jgi:hypothetical protein
MATITRGQLIAQTREFMDAVSSSRWSDPLILTVLNSVYEAEWSEILSVAPYYTFAQRSIATDNAGQIPFSALNHGSGDAQQNFYRILSVTDGNILYDETRFQDVPVATTSNYLPTYPRLYYLVGETVQILPIASGVPMIVSVNWKPTALADLSSDTITVRWPDNEHLVLVYEAASKLLLKGGAETSAAMDLKRLAREERAALLDDLRRRTINPTRLAYPDQKYDWAGG